MGNQQQIQIRGCRIYFTAWIVFLVAALSCGCSDDNPVKAAGTGGSGMGGSGTGGSRPSGGSGGVAGNTGSTAGTGGSGGQAPGGAPGDGGAAGVSGGNAGGEAGTAGTGGTGGDNRRWRLVGEENILGFNTAEYYIDLALAADGTPYVAMGHQLPPPPTCPRCVPPTEPHIARFNGTAWEDLNPTAFSPATYVPALEITPAGTPIVIVNRSVWQFNGTVWETLPSLPDDFYPVWPPQFAIGKDGAAYVAGWSAAGALVLRLGDTSWSEVGGGPLPVADVTAPILTIATDGRVIVALRTGDLSNILVFELDGSDWKQIGPAIAVQQLGGLAFAATGRPVVAYTTFDTSVVSPVTVSFDGNEWVGTGPIRVPLRNSLFDFISLTASDTVYMALNFFDIDRELDGRTVVRWTGSEWLPLDAHGYCIGDPVYDAGLKISATGIPYVAYTTSGFTVKRFE